MNTEIPAVEVIRSPKRKKSALIRVSDASVSVSVPVGLSEERISEILHKKRIWIKQKLKQQLALPLHKPKEYVNGEAFSYLGKNYRLKLLSPVRGQSAVVKMNAGYLEVPAKKKKARQLLEQWYRARAQDKLIEKVEKFSKKLGVKHRSVSVREYKSRWGSCSSKGDISLNWKIIMAPNRVVDYVVIHELCHLIEPNHSKAFWKQVSRVMPDYQRQKEWLKENGGTLTI